MVAPESAGREGKLPPLKDDGLRANCAHCLYTKEQHIICSRRIGSLRCPGWLGEEEPGTYFEAKPLKEAERWGVWLNGCAVYHVRDHNMPCHCVGVDPDKLHQMRGTRAEAEEFLARSIDLTQGKYDYTVKPYPAAKETSAPEGNPAPMGPGPDAKGPSRPKTETAPPLPSQVRSGNGVAAEGGAAKVDPYAAHRLAGERRRVELTRKIESNAKTIGLLKTELDAWVTELARLDRTGEVK